MSNCRWLVVALLAASNTVVGCNNDKGAGGGNAGAGGSSDAAGGSASNQAGVAGQMVITPGGAGGGGGPIGGASTSGGNAGNSGVGGGAGQSNAGTIQTQGATVALACPSPGAGCDAATGASVAATSLYTCNYRASTGNLYVDFRAGSTMSRIELYVAGFTGGGTYQANAEGTIDVVVVGGDVPSAATASGPPLRDCTIAATSNLAEIQIPADGDAPLLDVAFEVSCATLSAGGICDVTCNVSPAKFQLSVKGCLVSP